jgi:fatty acid desaturase
MSAIDAVRAPAPSNPGPSDPALSSRTPAIARRLNLTLTTTLIAMHGVVFFALPTLARDRPALHALILVPAVLSNLLWALIHEGIHGLIDSRPAVNNALARALSIVFGAPFAPLRFAHLRHHRYNRTPLSRDEVYDASRDSAVPAHLRYYAVLLGGLYFGELLLSFIAWLPVRRQQVLIRAMTPAGTAHPPELDVLARHCLFQRSALRAYRLDALATLIVWGIACWLWRDAWGWLVALIVIRGVAISIVDNAAHYATPLEDRAFAWNLRLPRTLSIFLLHFNLHRTHHERPALPWHLLPGQSVRDARDPSFFRALFGQLRGAMPITALPMTAQTKAIVEPDGAPR